MADICEYFKEPDSCSTGLPKTAFLRVSCPKCNLFKIKHICQTHLERAVKRIKQNGGMHCSICGWNGHCADFWTAYNDTNI